MTKLELKLLVNRLKTQADQAAQLCMFMPSPHSQALALVARHNIVKAKRQYIQGLIKNA